MKIKLFPFITEETLVASVFGDKIKINGVLFDLSGVPEGYRLPTSAIECKWFSASDDVERIDGELHLCLKLPIGWDSPVEFMSPPAPIVLDVKRGRLKFPDTRAVKND